jgi:lysophospholipase
MKYALSSALALVLSASASEVALVQRGAPANQPHGYVPQTVTCPQSQPTIRSAATLSSEEQSWLQVRRNATIDPMRDLLSRMNINGLDTNAYIDKYRNNASALPNIGMAMAGGGYRALLVGAGVIEAFDSRTPNSTARGQLGGLLQATTYLSGLSGGSWLVGSLYANNFTSVAEIINRASSNPSTSGDLWQFDQTIFEGPDSSGIQLLSTVDYATQVVDAVQGKEDAGFNTTITDYWGRTLSYQLINDTEGGIAYTYSSLASQDFITNGSAPLPLIVADGRTPGKNVISLNSTVFTFSPWELGSEDPNLYAFAPLKYVGTTFSGGVPAQSNSCIVGFDNYGYVMGTSSSLFNAILTTANATASSSTGLLSSAFKSAISSIVNAIGATDEDIADWPNPFQNYRSGQNRISQSDMLTLVDGGEDGQNIPLHPLIQPYRNVDVIFAVDNSADTNKTYPTDQSAAYWPAGVSLIATYERSLAPVSNGTAFPAIPDESTFLNLGLADRPT